MRVFKNAMIFVLIFLCAGFFSINYQFVEVRFIPDGMYFENVAVQLPLFIVVLISTGVGLLLGTVFEYLRGYKDRKEVKRKLIQAQRLNAESKHLKRTKISETEDILSLLK
jgi:uncharacterized integral membrane protein